MSGLAPLRIAAWNIVKAGRWGPGGIAEAVECSGASIALLGEWWPNATRAGTAPVERQLADRGWTVMLRDGASEADPGTMVATRLALEELTLTPTGMKHRVAGIKVRAGAADVAVVGAYVPNRSRGGNRKAELLDWLSPLPDELDVDAIIVAGDFNSDHADDTGAWSRDVREPAFASLFERGWRDGYRELHPPGTAASWWWKRQGRAGGFRIDHVLLAGEVRPLAVRYLTRIGDHQLVRVPGTPVKALSDHAMVLADLEVGAQAELAPNGETWTLPPH